MGLLNVKGSAAFLQNMKQKNELFGEHRQLPKMRLKVKQIDHT